jgi:pimeloyl-ACP methyl ester carboxylesterase
MEQPSLTGVRLVAVTMPGHAGAPPPDDYSVENYARLTRGLAARVRADVLVGFSTGATVALEMVATGAFVGPTVLLGISMAPSAEPAVFRGIIRLDNVLGDLPAMLLDNPRERIPAAERGSGSDCGNHQRGHRERTTGQDPADVDYGAEDGSSLIRRPPTSHSLT